MSKQIKFDKKVSGRDVMFNEPYWLSLCKRYRIANMKCARPFRVFRKLAGKNGWPWIGVGNGYNNKADAILAANKHANGIPVE